MTLTTKLPLVWVEFGTKVNKVTGSAGILVAENVLFAP